MQSNNEKIDYEKVCKVFYDVEEKLNLFQYSIDGVYFWKLIRLSVFIAAVKDLQIYERTITDSSAKSSFLLFKRIFHAIFHSCLLGKRKKNVLIFDVPRVFRFNGKLSGIYTFWMSNEFQKKGLQFEIIDAADTNQNHPVPYNPGNNLSYLENIYFLYNAYYRFKKFVKKNDLEFLAAVTSEFKKLLNIDLQLASLVEKAIRNFKQEYKFYTRLLNKRSPQKIYLICSYGKEALIAAAKGMNIETIEFQHGIMTSLHLGYHFPAKKPIHYFPDRIRLFGKYWHDIVSLPVEDKAIEYYGFPYLEEKLSVYANTSKKKNQILIISSDNVGHKMTEVAFELSKLLPEYKIIYKLHPIEFKIWKDAYPLLIEAIQLPNFELIDNYEQDLYGLLFESETVIGVSSTVIYEALAVNCSIILLNLPSVEYLKDLIENGYCQFADTNDDLIRMIRLNTGAKNPINKEYFFSNQYSTNL
jgi:hypothetical protein